jgi:U3 small nucleolar ribonucleoprotein component
MLINCQSNVKTKFSRVLAHIILRTILFETYDNLINENKIMVNRIKTKKYIDLLESVNNQIDALYIVYDHDYYDECYTGYY